MNSSHYATRQCRQCLDTHSESTTTHAPTVSDCNTHSASPTDTVTNTHSARRGCCALCQCWGLNTNGSNCWILLTKNPVITTYHSLKTHTSAQRSPRAGIPPAVRDSLEQPAPRPVWYLEGCPPPGSSTPVGLSSPTPPT